jgi:spermidine synthase
VSSISGSHTSAAQPFLRLLPLVFASGACALVYQVAWTRDFRLVFGASTPAAAAVVAIFVGGLGLGAWKVGARVERSPSPLLLYALLELTIAASSAVSPLLLALATRAYIALGGTITLGLAGATPARLLLSALVLAVPTMLMGGTLPALSRAVVSRDGDPARRRVALLYGVNTLGAVLGCLVATFLLLEKLGTHLTLWMAAIVNALVGLVALRMGLRAAEVPVGEREPSDPAPLAATAPSAFVLAAAAVVGFAFFLMELVFYRMLVPLLGGTVYTFGLVLAVALLGIGTGGALYSWLFARREARLSGFAFTCLLEALGLSVAYALGDRLAMLAIELRDLGSHGFFGYVAGWSLVTAIIVLPASIAAGVQFPVLVALLGRGRREVARHVGLAYAWNTVGAVAGAVTGGFGLMALLTAPGCWLLVVGLLAVTGLAAVALAWRSERRRIRTSVQLALATAVVVPIFVATGPTAAWRHSPIGAGRVSTALVASPQAAQSFLRDARRDIEWQADGVESTVAILRNWGYSFNTNGKSDGHCVTDAGTQVMGGLLGAMLHPAPRSAMVIGLGSGSTAGWLAKVPSIDRVDVVELEPAMLEVARRCAPVNEHALDNPKVHVTRGDAREVLSVSRQRYDIVFSEPSNPYRAGIASLYTREYYGRVVEHLDEGGIFLQWVQAYEIDAPTMRTIFATMATVFPHVEVWQLEEPDLVLVASRAPIVEDVAALRARVAAEPFSRALRAAWGVADLEGVLGRFVARARFVAELAATGKDPLNTDDRPVVEFGFARALGSPDEVPRPNTVRAWARAGGDNRPEITGGSVDWDLIDLERAEIPSRDGDGPYRPPEAATEDVRERLDFEREWSEANAKAALATWDLRPREPLTPTESLDVAEAAVVASDPRAPQWVERLARTDPLDALALEARWLSDHGRPADAAAALEKALVGYRTDPWASRLVMRRALDLAIAIAPTDRGIAQRMLELMTQPFALEMLRDYRLYAGVSILKTLGDARECRRVLEPFEPYTRWSEWDLTYRRDCYRATGDPRAAIADADLSRFLLE